jgi:hypothetical protein
MYLTYAEYLTMGGTLDEIPFNNFEFQAEAQINRATFNRLKSDSSFPNEVRQLMKYLVDLLERRYAAFSLGKNSSNADPYITSQSNDGVSISYNGISSSDLIKLSEADALNAIRSYLDGVTNEAGRRLLYRGVYPGE